MDLTITIPESVAQHLGDDPRRALLEPVLIEMVQKGKMSVGYAGSLLKLSRHDAIEWWLALGFEYDRLTEEQTVLAFKNVCESLDLESLEN